MLGFILQACYTVLAPRDHMYDRLQPAVYETVYLLLFAGKIVNMSERYAPCTSSCHRHGGST